MHGVFFAVACMILLFVYMTDPSPRSPKRVALLPVRLRCVVMQFAVCMWLAGTLGAVTGTLVFPSMVERCSMVAEMGAVALVN